ncbi:MAG: polysaccharide deacetylase family protein, partial [Flavobacteriales bacterium]
MNRIPIVYYHSVAPSRNEQWYKNALTLELVHFERLLKYLKNAGYIFLNLDEYFQYREDPSFTKRAVSLQFDDGYLDNYVFVYPLLKKYQAKATIFVNPAFVPTEEHVRPTLEDVWSGQLPMSELQHQGFINWTEMRLMESTGHIEIQSHTLTHAKYHFNDHLIDVHRP